MLVSWGKSAIDPRANQDFYGYVVIVVFTNEELWATGEAARV